MNLLFFKKTYKLSLLQSETLKVAILDSLRISNHDIKNYDEFTPEHDFLKNKIHLLENLIKELGLNYE